MKPERKVALVPVPHAGSEKSYMTVDPGRSNEPIEMRDLITMFEGSPMMWIVNEGPIKVGVEFDGKEPELIEPDRGIVRPGTKITLALTDESACVSVRFVAAEELLQTVSEQEEE